MSESQERKTIITNTITIPVNSHDCFAFAMVTDEDKLKNSDFWKKEIERRWNEQIVEKESASLRDILTGRKHLYYIHVFPVQFKEFLINTEFENDYMDAHLQHWYTVDIKMEWLPSEAERTEEVQSKEALYIMGVNKIHNKDLFYFDPAKEDNNNVNTEDFSITSHFPVVSPADKTEVKTISKPGSLQAQKVYQQLKKYLNQSQTNEEQEKSFSLFPKLTEDKDLHGFYYNTVVFYLNPLVERFIQNMGRLPQREFELRGSIIYKPDEFSRIVEHPELITEKNKIKKIYSYQRLSHSIKIINDNYWVTGLFTFPGPVGLINDVELEKSGWEEPSKYYYNSLPNYAKSYAKSYPEWLQRIDSFSDKLKEEDRGPFGEIHAKKEKGVIFHKGSLSGLLCSYENVKPENASESYVPLKGHFSVPLLGYYRHPDYGQIENIRQFGLFRNYYLNRGNGIVYGGLNTHEINRLAVVTPQWEKEKRHTEAALDLEQQTVLQKGKIVNADYWDHSKITLQGSGFYPTSDQELAIQYQRPLLIFLKYAGGDIPPSKRVVLDRLTLIFEVRGTRLMQDSTIISTITFNEELSYEYVCDLVLTEESQKILENGEEVIVAVYLHKLLSQIKKEESSGSLDTIEEVNIFLKENLCSPNGQEIFNADIAQLHNITFHHAYPHFYRYVTNRGLLKNNPILAMADMKAYKILTEKRLKLEEEIQKEEFKRTLNLVTGIAGLIPGLGTASKILKEGSLIVLEMTGKQQRDEIHQHIFSMLTILTNSLQEQNIPEAANKLNQALKNWSQKMGTKLKALNNYCQVMGVLSQYVSDSQKIEKLYRQYQNLNSFAIGYQDEDFGEDESSDMDSLLITMMDILYWNPITERWWSSSLDKEYDHRDYKYDQEIYQTGMVYPVTLRVRMKSRRLLNQNTWPLAIPMTEHFGRILDVHKLGEFRQEHEYEAIQNKADKIITEFEERFPSVQKRTLKVLKKILQSNLENIIDTCWDSSCDNVLQPGMDICPRSLDHKGWEDEGLLNAVLEEILKKVYTKEEYEVLFKKIELLKKEKDKKKIKKFIMEHAPFSLLTTGWGQIWSSEQDQYKWEKVDNRYLGEKRYLIYKK